MSKWMNTLCIIIISCIVIIEKYISCVESSTDKHGHGNIKLTNYISLIALTVDYKSEVLFLYFVWSVDNTSVDSSITIAQSSITGYLKHSGTIGIVSLSYVSIVISYFSSIGEEPVNCGVCRMARGAVNMEISLESEACLLIQAIAIDAKSYYLYIKPCSWLKLMLLLTTFVYP